MQNEEKSVFAALSVMVASWFSSAQEKQSPTVKLTTKLGVETTFQATYPFSSAARPVDRLLEQFKDGEDPGVLLALNLAYSPRPCSRTISWRVAPGWYEAGPRPLEPYSEEDPEHCKRVPTNALGEAPGLRS